MHDYLTISTRLAPASLALAGRVDAAIAKWPQLKGVVERIAPYELYRRLLSVIAWRLDQSTVAKLDAPPLPGDYGDGTEFEDDVRTLCECLHADNEGELVDNEVRRWHDLVRVFGLHLFALDVRQDSRRYQEIMTEIFAHLGVSKDFEELDDAERSKVIASAIPFRGDVWPGTLSPLTQDALLLYEVLHRAIVRFGPQCLGGNIISLTRSSADVLSVLWLWRWAKDSAARRGEPVAPSDLRIIPLFEKIGDLKRAPDTLAECLDQPLYAEHLAKQGKRQTVMVGYSDSTKDGGYLAACWGLYRSQAELQQSAARRGVKVTFFHGRGGSLGRGGGPAARGILSLPSEALDGTLRLTEQGEVLAERYDDVQVAYRHLEQVTWATLVASTVVRTTPKPEWPPLMETLSERSLTAYRELVDQPGFIPYFVETTPIEEIEDLPIGSRPSRRRGERTLGDLRAIPWVFSWTQNRSMIPAWYGLGASLSEVKYRDRRAWQMLCEMYRSWPFFQATIDNASLALAKADMYVAQRYAELADDAEVRERMWLRIASEYDRTRQAVLDVVGERELLSGVPWFKQSIEVRNPYVDPLNLIQIELLRRRRAAVGDEDAAYLRHLLRLSVQGVAAGMRTTG
jgi:phosphoenolpyruvate carboxylase